MTLLDPLPELVPYEELAATLAEAAMRLAGSPGRSLPRDGAALATALYAAGYRVVRERAPSRQLEL